jgi:hypothetical protein
MTVDSLIKTLMENFTFFTRTSRFKTFESWFLQYIEHTKRMIETHSNITFLHLMIVNIILTLDHMVRYKTWMRNKHVEFPQRLSKIYDAPKFLDGLLQDIRRLDATWVIHNDNVQTKMPQFQHQKAMITIITNMLGVDLKDQHVLPAPTTFTIFKDDNHSMSYLMSKIASSLRLWRRRWKGKKLKRFSRKIFRPCIDSQLLVERFK